MQQATGAEAGAQPAARGREVGIGPRAVRGAREKVREGRPGVGLGFVPLREELVVLLVHHGPHRVAAVRQRGAQPFGLEPFVVRPGLRVVGDEPVRVHPLVGDELFEVAHQARMHLACDGPPLVRIWPHEPAGDQRDRLGTGGLQEPLDLAEGGAARRDLAEQPLGCVPERWRQRPGG